MSVALECAAKTLDKGNICVTIARRYEIPPPHRLFLLVAKQYEDENGRSPYAKWFDDLHAPAAAKVTKAVARMEQGNFSNVTPVGSGVSENTIDFGPGYRIYFAKDGDQIIILLGGGSKKRQQKDIDLAIERWQDYKRRKKLGEK